MDVKRSVEPIELNAFLPYQFSLLADRISRQTAAVAKQHNGLNLSHWRVLAAIAEAPGRTANDVVAITPMDKGIVSRAVKSLIDMKLIVRKASKDDGRIGRLFLTAKGTRVYHSMAKGVRAVEGVLKAALSRNEQKALSALLSKLMEAT